MIAEMAARFHALFPGNETARGKWYRKEDGTETFRGVVAPTTSADWIEHLEGGVGLAVAPIRNDGTASWAVLDFDGVTAETVAAAVQVKKLPLLVCASKTQNCCHAFLFLRDPAPAPSVQSLMHYLGDVFLCPQDSQPNLLNMPYYRFLSGVRPCIWEGYEISPSSFLYLAETYKARTVLDADGFRFEEPTT